MSQGNANAKKTTNKQKKAVRRAEKWGGGVLPSAGKLVPQMIVIVVLGFLFTGIQAIDAYWIRAAIAGVIGAGFLYLIYAEGLNQGVADVSSSRHYVQAVKSGRVVTGKEDASCYHPLKALCASLVVFGVPLALSFVLAFNAKEYTYTLQSLPSWLSGTYAVRDDVMAPLAAYGQVDGMGVLDWIRMLVRLFELVLVNLFPDPQKMTASVDRLSPLMILLLPAAYMLGYLFAPSRFDKIDKLNRRAKKVAVRRAERRKVGPELLGAQNQVHYGHKKEEKARKKKELI